MKDYLNADELNSLMLIGVLLDTSAKIREDWMKRDNMTKDEHKALKMAETNLKKFYESVIGRLNTKEVEKILKRAKKFEFRILDEYTLKKLERDTKDKLVNAVVPREQFGDWCNEIMYHNCNGCTKHWEGCRLHEIFTDNFIPESSWKLENCRYAYKLSEKLEGE